MSGFFLNQKLCFFAFLSQQNQDLSFKVGNQTRSLRPVVCAWSLLLVPFTPSRCRLFRGSCLALADWPVALTGSPLPTCSPPTVLNHSAQPGPRRPLGGRPSLPALPAGPGYSLPVISRGLCTGGWRQPPRPRRPRVSQTRTLHETDPPAHVAWIACLGCSAHVSACISHMSEGGPSARRAWGLPDGRLGGRESPACVCFWSLGSDGRPGFWEARLLRQTHGRHPERPASALQTDPTHHPREARPPPG